jgi:hypothetical protein
MMPENALTVFIIAVLYIGGLGTLLYFLYQLMKN